MTSRINGFNIIQPTINFGIIGCVSSGKSTLLNSLFCDTYSDMNIERTTMIPQVYHCDPKIDKNKKYAKEIREQNEEINNKIIEQTENKKTLTIEDCREKVYKINPIEHFIKIPSNINVAIFDIPGLNDSQTKKTYFEYVNENFYKFDYILFVIEIYRFNSEEMDILKMINLNITNIKKLYNKDIKLLVICNKCDNMDLNKKTNKLELNSKELKGMYERISKNVKNELTINYEIIKYSAEDTYFYRMLDVKHSLDNEFIDKMGSKEFGKQWNDFKNSSTPEELLKILQDKINVNDRLKCTGYEGLIEAINTSLSSISEILISKINIIEDKIINKEKELVIVNSLFDNVYNYVKEIKIINKDVNFDSIINRIKDYWHHILLTAYPFTTINCNNHINIKTNYYETLIKHEEKYKGVKFRPFIINYIDKETDYFVSNLEIIISSSYTFNSFIETLTNIFENEGSLPIDKIVKCIYKIPINDIHNLILKFADYDISFEDTCKVYINYYKNYNYSFTSQIDKIKTLMLSKLFMKEYISTNNISYSLLSLIVEHNINIINCKITYEYLADDLEKDIESYLEPFKMFIKYINQDSSDNESEVDLLSIDERKK